MDSYLVFTDYIESAMKMAEYNENGENGYAGQIQACKGVMAFGDSMEECQLELRSVLESWMLIRLKLGHALPVIHGINLNKEVYHV